MVGVQIPLFMAVGTITIVLLMSCCFFFIDDEDDHRMQAVKRENVMLD